MENPDQGVIDFLMEQLKRREDERRRLHDQLVQTHSRNLATLIATWRFIVVTRVAIFALGVAGLQLIMSNIGAFLDTSRLMGIIETYKGLPSGIVKKIELWTPKQATDLVVLLVSGIAMATILTDILLALLQSRCKSRGLAAERYLQIEGLFHEIDASRAFISAPFFIVRAALLAFVIVVVGNLGQVMQ